MRRAVLALALASVTLAASVAQAQLPRPVVTAARTLPPPLITSRRLPNGLRLVVVERHTHPVVSLALAIPAGSRFDPAGREGTAQITAALMPRGTAGRTPEQLMALSDSAGGFFSALADEDWITLRAEVLRDALPVAMELVSGAVLRPTFPLEELESVRSQALSSLELELGQPLATSERLLRGRLFGAHPYARRHTTASVRAIRREDLLAHYGARIQPAGAVLVMAGDITPAAAERLVTAALGRWRGAAAAAAPKPVAFPPDSQRPILLIHRPGLNLATVMVASRTPEARSPIWQGTSVLGRVLAIGPNSRLFRALRRDRGWTYGVSPMVNGALDGGYFGVSSEVRADVADSALEVMQQELLRLRDQPVPVEEVAAAVTALRGAQPLAQQSVGQLGSTALGALLYGREPIEGFQTAAQLAKVTPATLQASARALIRPDGWLRIVSGDAVRLRDRLARLGPVQIVAPDGTPLELGDILAPSLLASLDTARLVPRRDSLVVMVQGRPAGFQRGTLERTADGFRWVEDVRVGNGVRQLAEASFTPLGEMRRFTLNAVAGGRETRIETTIEGGRVRGQAVLPGAEAPRTVSFDTLLTAGIIEEGAAMALLPALDWRDDARWSFRVFSSVRAQARNLTLRVIGREPVQTPGGTVSAFRAELSGGDAPVTLYIADDTTRRLLRVTTPGAPVEFVSGR